MSHDEKSARATDAIKSVRPRGERLTKCVLYVAASGKPADRGKSFALDGTSATVGASSTNDLVLTDSTVSGEHLRLTASAEGILVEDLGSTNGTYYLEQRVQSLRLERAARLRLGEVELDVLPPADAKAVPLSGRTSYHSIHGSSPAMRRVYTMLEMLENSDAPVLIEGETGTGKERVARELHANGGRREQKFVIIDCANVPRELIESELFGHEKGSFTGASADRVGAFETANGGTVFLDELGELPLELQPKLLRVLETGEYKRVGAADHRTTNVRVISATNRRLKAEAKAGTFREDLYYRVAVIRLALPPLRDRPEDIVMLAQLLARDISAGKTDALPEAALAFFGRYKWPGNIRELRNAVHQVLAIGMVHMDDDDESEANADEDSSLPSHFDESGQAIPYREARERILNQFEAAYTTDLLSQADGNLTEAARRANMDRKYLRKLLKKHGLYEEK